MPPDCRPRWKVSISQSVFQCVLNKICKLTQYIMKYSMKTFLELGLYEKVMNHYIKIIRCQNYEIDKIQIWASIFSLSIVVHSCGVGIIKTFCS